jgi:hypothetical protein
MNQGASAAKTIGKWLGILLIWGGIGSLFAPGHPLPPNLGYLMIVGGLPLYLWFRRYPVASGGALFSWTAKLIVLVFVVIAVAAILTN